MSTSTYATLPLFICLVATLFQVTYTLDCYSSEESKGGPEIYGDIEFNKTKTCPLGVIRCAVRRHYRTGNGSSYESLCLDEKSYNKLKLCGKRLTDRTHESTIVNDMESMVEYMDFCCCNGTLCNDKAFAQQCVNSAPHLVASFYGLLVASLVLAGFVSVR